MPVFAAAEPRLGTAVNFAILGGSTITSTGATIINGQLGLDPGTSVTGFPPGVSGTQHISPDAVASQAKADLAVAYNDAATAASTSNLTGQDLGGMTLPSGVYTFNSSAALTGTLTLTGTGVFIFQIGSTLTTAASSAVVLNMGAQACAVYWQIGSSATIGAGTQFQGNLIAFTSITMNSGASIVTGRALAEGGAVTLIANTITAPTGTCVPTPPPAADISITKTVDTSTPNAGSNVTFTVTATNNGPDSATGVQVTDLLPAGLSFLSAATSAGTYSSATGLWTVGPLINGANATLSIVATVAGTAAVTNTASKTAEDQVDPVSGNDTASVTVTGQAADISITKTVDNSTPNLGSNVTFTVTARNNGPSNATGVQVTDVLPAGLALVSATPSAGAFTSGTGVWNIGPLGNGVSATLSIVATVTGTTAVTNTATKTAEVQPDPVAGNDSASVSVSGQSADIAITKSVDNSAPNVNTNVTFTVRATNLGPSAATGVVVSDPLPAGLSLVSATASVGTTFAAGVWTVGSLASGASQTLTIVATVTVTTPVINTATKTAESQQDPVPGNNTASVTVTAQAADIGVTKTVSNTTPNYGAQVTYTVTATNNGPSNATGVQVTDILPAGLVFVSATSSIGTSYNSGSGLWSIGALANSASVVLSIVATVNTTAPATNTATRTAADQPDPVAGNNSAIATITPVAADIAIAKSVDNQTPSLGNNVIFTVTATNLGPSNATGVAVTDILPSGLAYVSATTSQGAFDSVSGIWSVGALANGGTATLTLTATVASLAGNQTNTATKTAEVQVDPVTTNDSASVTVACCVADIAVTKTVDNPTPNFGSNVTFTITATNNGPANANGLQLTDQLPSGLIYVTSAPSVGAYNPVSGVWTIGGLATGLSATLGITATVNTSNPTTNTAAKTAENEADTTAADDTARATIAPIAADIAVTKTVSNSQPNVNSDVTFTVSARNNGPSNASGVRVTDLLPAGLTFVSYTASAGTYTFGTGIWDIGPLANGIGATLSVVATVTRTTAVTNIATKTAEVEPDQLPGNDSASASVTGQAADIAVLKTVSDPTPNLGSRVTFVVTATNNGPSNATGVQITDLLPAGLAFVSAAASSGAYDPLTGVWNLGPLADGVGATLSIIVTVNTTTSITNLATRTAGNQPDVVPANDSSSATVTGQAADIAITKTVSSSTPNLGGLVTFTVNARNNGPSSATGVQVTDVLPAGLTLISATPSAGSYNVGVWNVGPLANGGIATLSILATVTQIASITNTATKTAEVQPDSVLTNDSAAVTINPVAADVAITKAVSDATPNLGSNVSFTITATNNGPTNATGVQVTDVLPAGLTYVSSTPSTGTYNAGVWNIGPLANGVSATLSVIATVSGTTPVVNTAIKTAEVQPDQVPGNDSASVTVTGQAADIGVTKTVSNSAPAVGENVTYTLVAQNFGPSTAPSVQLRDVLPATLTFVGYSATQGTFNAVTGLWTIGTLANGATASMSLVVKVSASGLIINTITGLGGGYIDANSSNDSASAALVASVPGLPGLPNTSGAGAGAGAPDRVAGTALGFLAVIAGLGILVLAGAGRRPYRALFTPQRSRRRRHHFRRPATGLVAVMLSLALFPLAAGQLPSPPAGPNAAETQLIGGKVVAVAPPAALARMTFHLGLGPIVPTRLRVPSIGVDSAIVAVGLRADGSMDVPDNLWTSSWLAGGPRPGDAGNVVIAGHRGVGSPALFSHLENVKPGDRIYVSDRAGNELAYSVTRVASLDLSTSTQVAVFSPTPAQQLVLVTCFGAYIAGAGTYDHRLVVFSQPLQ